MPFLLMSLHKFLSLIDELFTNFKGSVFVFIIGQLLSVLYNNLDVGVYLFYLAFYGLSLIFDCRLVTGDYRNLLFVEVPV